MRNIVSNYLKSNELSESRKIDRFCVCARILKVALPIDSERIAVMVLTHLNPIAIAVNLHNGLYLTFAWVALWLNSG